LHYQRINWKSLWKVIGILLLLCVLTLAAVGDSWRGVTARANGIPIKVMPLGDSITVGKYSGTNTSSPGGDFDDIGYREDLYTLLTGAGYTIDFVGTTSNGVFADPDHEGHNGVTDEYIADNIYNEDDGENWLNLYSPDVVLLHIGTNLLDPDPSDVQDILDEIDDYESDMSSTLIVIVARIIDWVPNNPVVHTFNNHVETMVKNRSDYGIGLFLVDMEGQAGLINKTHPTGDMFNSLHPYSTGYMKMAECWKLKLDEIYYPGTYNSLPVFDFPVGNQNNTEGEPITPLDMGASDSNGEDLVYSGLNLPPGLSIASDTGVIAGDIDRYASAKSPYYVAISVSDGNSCGNTRHLLNWTINEVNEPPEIQSTIPDQTNVEGDYVEVQVDATDPNDPDLTYSANNLPAGIFINQNSGLIFGTISFSASEQAQYPHYLVEVTVEDDGNPSLDDSTNFNWMVGSDKIYMPLALLK
jgi:hypothetical protein